VGCIAGRLSRYSVPGRATSCNTLARFESQVFVLSPARSAFLPASGLAVSRCAGSSAGLSVRPLPHGRSARGRHSTAGFGNAATRPQKPLRATGGLERHHARRPSWSAGTVACSRMPGRPDTAVMHLMTDCRQEDCASRRGTAQFLHPHVARYSCATCSLCQQFGQKLGLIAKSVGQDPAEFFKCILIRPIPGALFATGVHQSFGRSSRQPHVEI